MSDDAPTTEPPQRKRPTVAAMHELALERDAERARRVRTEQQLQHSQANLDAAIAERDAERAKWQTFDAEALALGRLVEPLQEYVTAVRRYGWSGLSHEEQEPEEAVRAAVARILIAVGSRFGADLTVLHRVSAGGGAGGSIR